MNARPVFRYHQDHVPFEKKDWDGLSVETHGKRRILVVSPELLTRVAKKAVFEISHFLRPGHLEKLAAILRDPEASSNDRYVALDLLKNANTAAGGVLPMCQDTGTAIVFAKKGESVWTEGDDEAAFTQGIYEAYRDHNLRYSQMAPLDMFREVNTKNNLPAQIDIHSTRGNAYEILFVAKGGGSANKAFLFQQTRAVLTPEKLAAFLEEKIRGVGTAACPPYHLAVVIGGTSAEQTMKTVKLASCHYLDNLPSTGDETGRAFRDGEWEEKILRMTGAFGIGAQFGGKYFCHDVRVVRLPRHGASLPVGIGVSCSADRQILTRLTPEGVFFEKLEHDPARFLPEIDAREFSESAVNINLDLGMKRTLEQLDRLSVATRVELNGSLVVARDIAHAKLREKLEKGEELPDYFKEYPVYYAGPAKTPAGKNSGSFGPTTAGRMDAYVETFQQRGGSMVTLAKGNRSPAVCQSCQRYGGFYLGTIGGSAARLAEERIRKIETLDFPELGMEAVWKIEVEHFPAFVVIDNKGNDFFAKYGIAVE